MQLKENLEIKVVPTDIENIFTSKITKVDENNIYFELGNNVLSVGEVFDAYAFFDNGICFFTACADKIEDNVVQFSNKVKVEHLQRRQYARIKMDSDVKITQKNSDTEIEAWLVDISVGGFKMHTKKSFDMQGKYFLNINLNNKEMVLEFKPISQVKEMENLYTVSARYENIDNTDKITLVQYCYKKQAEKVNE